MKKKKNNYFLLVPAFLLFGTAVGVQTDEILKYSLLGIIVGFMLYFLLNYRNKIKLKVIGSIQKTIRNTNL